MADPSAELVQAEIKSAIHVALERLPLAYREVITACCLNEEPIREFARRMGRPVETCRTQKKRAQKLLAKDLSLRSFL